MINFIYRLLRLKKITSRLFLWIILLIMLSGCLHLISYMAIDKEKRITDTKSDLEYALSTQQTIIENWADDRMNEIRYLASLPVTKQFQLERMKETYQHYLDTHDELTAIVILDENGYVLLDSATSDVFPKQNVRLQDQEYFIAAKEGNEYLFDVVTSKATNETVILFSAPVLSESDQLQGVVIGAANVSKINELLSHSIKDKGGRILLVNHEGSIVTQISKSGNNQTGRLDTVIMDKITAGETPPTSYLNDKGEEVYSLFTPLFNERYFLINEINKKEVLQSHYQMLGLTMVITLIVIMIGWILMIPVIRHLVQPFHHLVTAINKIKAGNYRMQLNRGFFKGSSVEIRQFMHLFNEMLSTIHKNHQTLQKLSNTDELTGVANRRVFEDHLDREWHHGRREKQPLSLIFMDIDYFKEFNDMFGHQAGDECLRKVAQTAKNTINRPRDLIARYGGEEFVIALPETELKDAVRLAEKVRRQVEQLQIPHSEGEHVTVSIGVASVVPTKTMDKELLIESADKALYKAKALGRNRVMTNQ